MTSWHAVPIIAGEAVGAVLRFTQPISLWGGIDPHSGRVIDPRHPQHGEVVTGRVMVLPGTVGSSSSSYIMLELMASGHGPAAVIVPEADAILSLGVIVAREMGHVPIPVLQLSAAEQSLLPDGCAVHIRPDGSIHLTGPERPTRFQR